MHKQKTLFKGILKFYFPYSAIKEVYISASKYRNYSGPAFAKCQNVYFG